MGKLERRIVWGVVFGVVVYMALAGVMGAGEVWSRASGVGAGVVLGALGLSCVNYAVRFMKWQYYLRVLGVEGVGWGSSLNVFVSGFVMSVTPGKVGEVLKSVLLEEEHGVAIARTAPVVLAERLTDLLGLCAIAGLGVWSFEYGRWAVAAALALVAAALVALGSPRFVGWCLGKVEGARWLGGLHPKLVEAYGSTRALLGFGPLVLATGMSAASWSMEGAAFYWIVSALGGGGGVLEAMFLFAVTTIAGAVSFLPGGVGVTEGGMIGGLAWMGVLEDEASASAAAYLIRLVTLWFGVGLGVASLAIFRVRMRARGGGRDHVVEGESDRV